MNLSMFSAISFVTILFFIIFSIVFVFIFVIAIKNIMHSMKMRDKIEEHMDVALENEKLKNVKMKNLKCPSCGASVKIDDQECKYCGASLIKVKE